MKFMQTTIYFFSPSPFSENTETAALLSAPAGIQKWFADDTKPVFEIRDAYGGTATNMYFKE